MVEAVSAAIKKRFGKCFLDDDYVLASGLHPHFKLKWLQLLTKYDWKLLDNVNMAEKRVKLKIVKEVKILARQMATPEC